MLKVYTPPYITMLISVNIMNIFFSTYFITLLLIGVTFKILTVSIKEERNLLILFSIITFLVIENSQGLKIFSLTLSSMVIYLFIVPRLKNLFSSTVILDFIYIFILYIFFYILTQSYIAFDLSLITIFLMNFFIDIIIVGLVL
jgi:hypothetical protein